MLWHDVLLLDELSESICAANRRVRLNNWSLGRSLRTHLELWIHRNAQTPLLGLVVEKKSEKSIVFLVQLRNQRLECNTVKLSFLGAHRLWRFFRHVRERRSQIARLHHSRINFFFFAEYFNSRHYDIKKDVLFNALGSEFNPLSCFLTILNSISCHIIECGSFGNSLKGECWQSASSISVKFDGPFYHSLFQWTYLLKAVGDAYGDQRPIWERVHKQVGRVRFCIDLVPWSIDLPNTTGTNFR